MKRPPPSMNGTKDETRTIFTAMLFCLVENRLEDRADALHVRLSHATMSRQVHSPQSTMCGVRIERGILVIGWEEVHRIENWPSLDPRFIEFPHHVIALRLATTLQYYGLHP